MIHIKHLSLFAFAVFFFACTSQNSTETKVNSTDSIETDTVAIPDSVIEKPGVVMFKESDVRATGNEPFWMIELKKDSVHFKLIGGFEFTQLLPPPQINTKDSLQYNFQAAAAEVTVLVQDKVCTDGMSGFKSPFTVKVNFTGPDNTQTYKGCGDYVSAFDKVREPR